MDEPIVVRPAHEPDSLMFDIPDTVDEMFGPRPLTAPRTRVPVESAPEVTTPAPVVSPVSAPVPAFDPPNSERMQLTGSDYVFYGAVATGTLAGLGVAATLGYVIYTLVTSVFGAAASGVAATAGVLPLLALGLVVFLCARGRGGARSGGVPVPGVGSPASGLLGTTGSVVGSVLSPVARLSGLVTRGGKSRRFDGPGAPGVAVPSMADSRSRLGRLVGRPVDPAAAGSADGFTGEVAQPSMLSRVVSRGPSKMAGQVGFTAAPRSLSRRAADGALGRFRVGRALGFGAPTVVAAPVGSLAPRVTLLGRVLGTPAPVVTSSGAVLGAPHRGLVRSFLAGGAGSAPVVPGVAQQSRVSRLMFGDFSPTAQMAAMVAGKPISLGLWGLVTGANRKMRSAPDHPVHGQSSPVAVDLCTGEVLDDSSDVLIADLVGLGVGALTIRWCRRMATASSSDQVYGAWRTGALGHYRYCAVGFLWDEMDPHGWFKCGKGYFHRDARRSAEMYSSAFLWKVVNHYEAQDWTLKQCAENVHREVSQAGGVEPLRRLYNNQGDLSAD